MALVERIYGTEVQLFEGKEEYFFCNGVSESKGLLMLRTFTGTGVNQVIDEFPYKKVSVLPFNHLHLLFRQSLQTMLDSSILSTKVFLDSSNARALSKGIVTWLVSNFQFIFNLGSRKSKIIIVVNVYLERFVDITDDEIIMKYSLPFRGGGGGVDEDEDEDDGEDDDDEEEEEEEEEEEGNGSEYENDEVEKKEMETSTTLSVEENHDQYDKEEDEVPEVLKEIEAPLKLVTLTDDDRLPTYRCSICLKGFLRGADIATTPCSHVFHCNCIFDWLPNNNSCPMCRSLCATIVHI